MKTIPLTRGLVAIISNRDFPMVGKHKWTATKNSHHKTWYAHRNTSVSGVQKKISLHRFIMNAPVGMEVDHKDGNGLNNTRSNLRLCTTSQNKMNMRCRNKHGFKGIVLCSGNRFRKWKAKIWINGKSKHIGCYESPEEAALAYNRMAKKHFGRFARLNVVFLA